MGYRSDVTIVVAFRTKEQMAEVLSIYMMNPNVQKHNVFAQWKLRTDHDPPYMLYQDNDVKWYPNYEDVMASEHIASVCANFEQDRGFEYAYRLVRIGEEDSDVVVDDFYSDDSYDLIEFVQDGVFPVRRIECSL